MVELPNTVFSHLKFSTADVADVADMKMVLRRLEIPRNIRAIREIRGLLHLPLIFLSLPEHCLRRVTRLIPWPEQAASLPRTARRG